MAFDLKEDTRETVWIKIPIDSVTAARLRKLADMCHNAEEAVAASLLHDVLADDEEHDPEPASNVVQLFS